MHGEDLLLNKQANPMSLRPIASIKYSSFVKEKVIPFRILPQVYDLWVSKNWHLLV